MFKTCIIRGNNYILYNAMWKNSSLKVNWKVKKIWQLEKEEKGKKYKSWEYLLILQRKDDFEIDFASRWTRIRNKMRQIVGRIGSRRKKIKAAYNVTIININKYREDYLYSNSILYTENLFKLTF